MPFPMTLARLSCSDALAAAVLRPYVKLVLGNGPEISGIDEDDGAAMEVGNAQHEREIVWLRGERGGEAASFLSLMSLVRG